jgi:hypothetical protein
MGLPTKIPHSGKTKVAGRIRPATLDFAICFDD